MVGKTSISTRFIKGKFIKIDLSNRTINTNCFQKRIQINDLIFNLNVWDTAGEEKYHAMAPIFYRGAQGAVVIFDVTNRETFKRAQKWFKELNEYAEGNPKIILVGNKIDLPNREITNEEATALAQQYKCNFLEVSALLGTNVNEIFNSLALSIYQGKKNSSQNYEKEFGESNYSNNTNNTNTRGRKFNIVTNNENMATANRKGSCC
jgi:small GTP-binding protein